MAARRTVATLTRAECLKVLGVGESASAKEVRTVFLVKAKRLHPDMPSGSEERFKELMTAYSVLQQGLRKPYSGTDSQSGDMPDYDFKDQKSYKATHSRNHHTHTCSFSSQSKPAPRAFS